jgi:hypothetical protein
MITMQVLPVTVFWVLWFLVGPLKKQSTQKKTTQKYTPQITDEIKTAIINQYVHVVVSFILSMKYNSKNETNSTKRQTTPRHSTGPPEARYSEARYSEIKTNFSCVATCFKFQACDQPRIS